MLLGKAYLRNCSAPTNSCDRYLPLDASGSAGSPTQGSTRSPARPAPAGNPQLSEAPQRCLDSDLDP